MALHNPYQAYQSNAVTTASPGELTLMLYNGCLRFIKAARMAMENKEIEKKNEEGKKLQPQEQEFKGRKIQEQVKSLTKDRDATLKWYEELGERMQTFGFIIDDPDLEVAEKT